MIKNLVKSSSCNRRITIMKFSKFLFPNSSLRSYSTFGNKNNLSQLGNCGMKITHKDPTSASSGGSPPDDPMTIIQWDLRKYGHKLPQDHINTPFPPLPQIPTGVFRCTDSEVLGPCSHKCGFYKNPEYYSFHDRSFFDLHYVMKPCRQPRPKSGRKPISF